MTKTSRSGVPLVRLTGPAALDRARAHGLTLSTYDGSRDGLSLADAEAIADPDPGLVYVDVEFAYQSLADVPAYEVVSECYMAAGKVRGRCHDLLTDAERFEIARIAPGYVEGGPWHPIHMASDDVFSRVHAATVERLRANGNEAVALARLQPRIPVRPRGDDVQTQDLSPREFQAKVEDLGVEVLGWHDDALVFRASPTGCYDLQQGLRCSISYDEDTGVGHIDRTGRMHSDASTREAMRAAVQSGGLRQLVRGGQ